MIVMLAIFIVYTLLIYSGKVPMFLFIGCLNFKDIFVY